MGSFAEFFRSTTPARDKYLSRLFGLFSEEVVRTWCAHPEAPYVDLGRPTLYLADQPSGQTLDFTLRKRDSGERYVAELKCELEYEGYKYLTLVEAAQVRHHLGRDGLSAFARFVRTARDPTSVVVRRDGQIEPVDGAILVWGAVTPEGRAATMADYGFADILSVEAMVADLQSWAPASWSDLTQRYQGWTGELFDFLAGPVPPQAPTSTEGRRK